MPTRILPGDAESPAFAQALRELRDVRLRPEVTLTEVPAPSRIAPHAVALSADVLPGRSGADAEDEQELASGRFVLLHDPDAPEAWDGVWRVVTFVRAAMEPELASDPVLGQVGWSWLADSLAAHELQYTAEGGTVTRVVSESFAGLADREASVEMEIRASWTPLGDTLGAHLEAWGELLCTVAGLPPLPDGVVAMPGRRR